MKITNNFGFKISSRELNLLMALARKPEMFQYIKQKLKSSYSIQLAEAMINGSDDYNVLKDLNFIKSFI